VVGYGTTANGPEAFRWTEATGMIGLGELSGIETVATGVSADGAVVVGETDVPGGEAFRWTSQTGLVGLGSLPNAFQSKATAVSADGSVIVGSNRFQFTIHFEASRWTDAEGWSSLGDLPGGPIFSGALDVSANGSVIVGSSQTEREDGFMALRAFYWTPSTGMLNLQDTLVSLGAPNVEDWTLDRATGISHDGRTIVGWGTHDGRTEAWVATIPEPSAIVLAALAVLVVAAVYWRNRGWRITQHGSKMCRTALCPRRRLPNYSHSCRDDKGGSWYRP
jgi:probable HAF family extracellular repeat protein